MSNHAWSAQRHSSNAENAVANLKSNCEFVGVLTNQLFRAKYLTEPQQEIRGSVAYNLIEDGVSSRTTIRTATIIAYREIQRLLRGKPTRESDSAGESREEGQ